VIFTIKKEVEESIFSFREKLLVQENTP